MAQVAPLNAADLPQFADRFAVYEKIRGFIPNSILTMARRPAIAEAFMALNKAVLYEGTVSEELKMLISLIASQAAGCRYCQAHMANLARVYKASDSKIRAVWEYSSSDLFTDAERAALRLAHHAAQVPCAATDDDFAQAKKYFDDDQIVEIVASIALFGYLNRWNDTMATQLEQHPASVASEVIEPVGWSSGKHS